MKEIIIPDSYNYIAVFLTLSCNYRCSYCINYDTKIKTNRFQEFGHTSVEIEFPLKNIK